MPTIHGILPARRVPVLGWVPALGAGFGGLRGRLGAVRGGLGGVFGPSWPQDPRRILQGRPRTPPGIDNAMLWQINTPLAIRLGSDSAPTPKTTHKTYRGCIIINASTNAHIYRQIPLRMCVYMFIYHPSVYIMSTEYFFGKSGTGFASPLRAVNRTNRSPDSRQMVDAASEPSSEICE